MPGDWFAAPLDMYNPVNIARTDILRAKPLCSYADHGHRRVTGDIVPVDQATLCFR
jgi:hypothetical protein